MTGIIFATQLIDEDHPVLGFTPGLVRALAQRVPVAVIAGEVRGVPADLGAEILSLGKDRHGKLRRGLEFERAVAALCRRLRPAVLYAHMCPDYVTFAAPVTKATRTPSVLWFTHSSDSRALRRAERLADAVVTALPSSYPRPSPKVAAIGHSIDTRRFAYREPAVRDGGPLELVAVGRVSAVKNYPTMVRGVAEARRRGVDVRLRILGPATTDGERRLRAELASLIDSRGLDGIVTVDEGVPPAAVPGAIEGAHTLVNASRPGQADKVVFEAMACGRPTLVSSPAFGPLVRDLDVELAFDEGDSDGLASRIEGLAAADHGAVCRTAATLRARVEAEHSLDHWADAVVDLAGRLTSRSGSASRAARR